MVIKKNINGNIIPVDIDIFEKAVSDALVNRKVDNVVHEWSNTVQCGKFIKGYKTIYRSLPYPLRDIDCDLKYAVIGIILSEIEKNEYVYWVEDGLNIGIKYESSYLKFINTSWGIVDGEVKCEDEIDIEKYELDIGFEDYIWVLDQLRNKILDPMDYYKQFMPQFYRACGGDKVVIGIELNNLLEFAVIKDDIGKNIADNTIIDVDDKTLYKMEVYYKGKKETGNIMAHLRVNGKKITNFETPEYKTEIGIRIHKMERVKENKYLIYKKAEEDSLEGATRIFELLVDEGGDYDGKLKYKAMISDGSMAFTIDGDLYVCKAYKASETTYITSGVKMLNIVNGILYFIRRIKLKEGLYKEQILSYALSSKELRLCRIQFVNI